MRASAADPEQEEAGPPNETRAVDAVEQQPLRLAMFSPVPPIHSGIAAYLVDLLPLLPGAWSIDVFTDEGVEVDPSALRRGGAVPGGDEGSGRRGGVPDASEAPGHGPDALVPCFPHTEFAARHAREPYDLSIYQVGNATARAYMLDYVTAHPGLLVLHDGVLHPARFEAAIAAGDVAGYRRMAASCRQEAGSAIGHLVAGGLGGPALYRTFPMCEDLVRASRATAMHGELACGWLRGLVPEAPVVPLVHWRSVEFDVELRDTWRRRLGGDENVIIGSFGNIGPERRLDRVFRALAEIESTVPWRLVVAGGIAPDLGLEGLAAELGIGARISWHAGLSDADFVALMAAIDLAINLRYPPARASSGVLHQLLQLGVPAVISDVVHWREYPHAAVLRVPPGPDETEHEALRDGLSRWLVDTGCRAVAAASAMAWASAHLTPARMRGSYIEAVAAALRMPAATRA